MIDKISLNDQFTFECDIDIRIQNVPEVWKAYKFVSNDIKYHHYNKIFKFENLNRSLKNGPNLFLLQTDYNAQDTLKSKIFWVINKQIVPSWVPKISFDKIVVDDNYKPIKLTEKLIMKTILRFDREYGLHLSTLKQSYIPLSINNDNLFDEFLTELRENRYQ